MIDIWEQSVRATHDFLPDANIVELKPLILEHYFDAVTLRVARDKTQQILGFVGVAEENVEMLFILPNQSGKGIGGLLLKHAIKELSANKVDVNEQNPNAIAFYQYIGFKVVNRSDIDGQGNPFPLLHMVLS